MSNADDKDDLIFLNGQALQPEDVHEVYEHVSPQILYVKILGALFVLTGLTYAVSYLNLGPASLPVAMLVALAKASLVATFFMHLKGDEKYHTFVFVSSLLFVGIFFTFTMFDLNSRDRLSQEQGTFFQRQNDPSAGMPDRQPGLSPFVEGTAPALTPWQVEAGATPGDAAPASTEAPAADAAAEGAKPAAAKPAAAKPGAAPKGPAKPAGH